MVDRLLPKFPWDSLTIYRDLAARHREGVVDLSVGTPVDPTPEVAQAALREAADAPGYPPAAGTSELKSAVSEWLTRRFGLPPVNSSSVLPCVGSKELVAWLPTLLDLGAGDCVVYPELAYPTYDIGARLAGARPVRVGATFDGRVGLIWLNSPANPHGEILTMSQLTDAVASARDVGAVLAVDECYLEFGWDAKPVSVLDPEVNGGSLDGILAVNSLSKRSNLAGYRAGFAVGDPRIVEGVLEWRRHAGFMVPSPVQHAMAAALGDDEHVDVQREIYLKRRSSLRRALEAAGFRIDGSDGGLYLWATRGDDCWATVDWMAQRGIVVTPGEFYGPAGSQHVRVALTATDADVAAAVTRLSQ